MSTGSNSTPPLSLTAMLEGQEKAQSEGREVEKGRLAYICCWVTHHQHPEVAKLPLSLSLACGHERCILHAA